MATRIIFITCICVLLSGCTKSKKDQTDERIYTSYDVAPIFADGDYKIEDFVKNNSDWSKCPANKEGNIFVECVILKSGEITNVRIALGLSNECDDEAIRIVSKMHEWKPAEINGHAVNAKWIIIVHKPGGQGY